MTMHRFSRRRLLGSWLAGLAAWLCPRPRRVAAPPLSAQVATPSTTPSVPFTSYSYDNSYDKEPRLPTTSYFYNGNHCLYYIRDSSGDRHDSA